MHFYALFLLGQFQEKSSFPRIMELASLPGDALDYLIGNAITSGLSDVLYNTYNGDRALLEKTVRNPDVDDFAKSGMLDVLGQLYRDGSLEKEEFQGFIREIVNEEEEIGEYIYTSLVNIICDCHFVDILPEIRRLYKDGRVDQYAVGQYEDCVDAIFWYEYERDFCTAPMNAAKIMSIGRG